MSSISLIYDAIADVIEAQLPTYRRLPNAYVLTENSYLNLDKGYSMSVRDGVNTQRYINQCFVTWRRLWIISLVRRVTTTDQNIAQREIIEKDILEDHAKILKAFFLNNELNQPTSGNVIKSEVVSDTGIDFLDADTLKFLRTDIYLEVEYQESPTA